MLIAVNDLLSGEGNMLGWIALLDFLTHRIK